VVQIFDHLNKTKEGTFVISKGQYVDSKEKIDLDDVFISDPLLFRGHCRSSFAVNHIRTCTCQ
jgi:hypothetical protein